MHACMHAQRRVPHHHHGPGTPLPHTGGLWRMLQRRLKSTAAAGTPAEAAAAAAAQVRLAAQRGCCRVMDLRVRGVMVAEMGDVGGGRGCSTDDRTADSPLNHAQAANRRLPFPHRLSPPHLAHPRAVQHPFPPLPLPLPLSVSPTTPRASSHPRNHTPTHPGGPGSGCRGQSPLRLRGALCRPVARCAGRPGVLAGLHVGVGVLHGGAGGHHAADEVGAVHDGVEAGG